MKNILFAIAVLGGYVGLAMGSEKDDGVIVFKAAITALQNNPLRYCQKEYIDFLNKDYGIQCAYNEPLIGVSYQQNSQSKLIERITFIPFKYFLDNSGKQQNNSSSFKQCDVELLSCSNQSAEEKNKFRIVLGTDFNNKTPQDLLNEFKEIPQCALGSYFDKKSDMLSWRDPYEVEKELCSDDVIRQIEGKGGWEKIEWAHGKMERFRHKYAQGINGYFGEEVKEKIRQDHKAMQTALFYSRIRKLFGFSIAAIIAYLLYQKLYNTVELI